jgi:hypothetical protein
VKKRMDWLVSYLVDVLIQLRMNESLREQDAGFGSTHTFSRNVFLGGQVRETINS